MTSMTRELAKEKVFLHEDMRVLIQAREDMIPEIDMCHILRKDVLKHVDKIYDDFESRTCENCKFYGAEHERISHPNYRTCINTDSFTYMQEPHYEDGCNKFKRKEHE